MVRAGGASLLGYSKLNTSVYVASKFTVNSSSKVMLTIRFRFYRLVRLSNERRQFTSPQIMEVLLLQDIKGIGQKDDLLIVGDGYALNFLLPQSKALIATPTVRRRYADRIRRRAVEREKLRMADQQKAVDISKMTLSFSRKASDAKKLYAAVSEKNIVEALKDQHDLDVAESAVVIRDAIKTLGDHSVEVVLPGARALLTVKVEEEK